MLGLKDGETRSKNWLSTYEGLYILVQESKTVDEKQVDKALKIANDKNVPEHNKKRCQAACAKEKQRGRVVAILELGKTHYLDTAEKQTEWEKRTFVPAADLKNNYVTEITKVHRITRPWHLSGGQTIFHAWAQLDDLPSDLDPDILQISALEWA